MAKAAARKKRVLGKERDGLMRLLAQREMMMMMMMMKPTTLFKIVVI